MTLSDETLFLKFVMLERAVQLDDFESVWVDVQNLKNYAESMEKRHLVFFAYMYLLFSGGTPKTYAGETLEDVRWHGVVDYRREVTPNERLTGDWASVWYKRYSPTYFRALYANNLAL